jgi:hypothetical protein
MRAVRLLQDQGLPFHVITVLTERALDYPEQLFDFYVQNGIKEVGFNIEEIEGANTRSSLARNGVEAKVRAFMRRFFALVWDTRGLLKVREFESALGHLLADAPVRDEQNDRRARRCTLRPAGRPVEFSPGPAQRKVPGGSALSTRNTKLQLGACNHSGDVNQIDAERRPPSTEKGSFRAVQG